MGTQAKHECSEDKTCCCYILGLEPDEDCPVHGHPWPPRCECGKFVKRKTVELKSVRHEDCDCVSCLPPTY